VTIGHEEGTSNSGVPVGRRVVLGMLGLGAIGVVAGKSIQGGLDSALSPIQRLDPTGLAALIPGDYFRIYTVTSGYPSETDAEYRLTVDGMVETPRVLTVADLQAMPATSMVRTFQCVTGWQVPNVHWTGVKLSDLLSTVGVAKGATALRFESFDGVYTESLTLDQAARPDIIVAYSMLGGPVSRDHGGPVRLYVAPMYGYKSIKWLSRITVVDAVEPGYWEHYGYAVDGWIGRSNGY